MALPTPTSALKLAFLECHAEGHQWRPDGLIDAIEAEPGLRPPYDAQDSRGKRSHCVCCGGDRVRWYTRSGEVTNRYRMVEGYYHKRSAPDDYAPSRQAWRQELFVTLFDEPKPTPRKRRRAA